MAEDSLKNKTLSGLLWSAINRFGQQGIGFVFNILIARQLMPSDYGVIAMFGVFLSISQTFIDSGFANALVRKPDRTEKDYNTVFYFNVAISLFCYSILFFAAPAIARFYDQPILVRIIRIIGLTLIMNAVVAVQGTEMTIRMDFKARAYISLFVSVLAGAFSLVLAYSGKGVWALVWQQFASSLLGGLMVWGWIRWRPKLMFSIQSFREMFSFGSKLLASGLLNTIYGNLSSIIIGKVYTASDLGEYSKASSLAGFPSTAITSVVQSVSFPALARVQNQKDRLENYYKQFINLTAFIVIPIMIGIASVAKPLTVILLTDKWIGMVPLLRIVCFGSMWYPVHAINLNLLQVLGRSDYFLKLEVWKKILGVIVLIVTVPMGVMVMCVGQVIYSFLGLFINTYYTKRLIGYGIWDQLRNLSHILVHSLVMGAIVVLTTALFNTYALQLSVGVTVGVLYYFVGAYIFRFPELHELLNMAKDSLHLSKHE